MACVRTSFLYSLDKYWSFVSWLCRFDKLMDRRASPVSDFNCGSDCVCGRDEDVIDGNANPASTER